MIWLVIDEKKSETIVASNIHEEGNVFQLWVTKLNGKTQKIKESTDKAEITLIKDAIDYANENKETTLRLK